MFQAAEVGRTVPKADYKRELPELRTRLIEAQQQLRHSNRSVVIILEGVHGAGRGALANRLQEWLDPRGVETHALWDLSDEELQRPYYWRFWRRLPARGRITVLFGGWYQDLLTRGGEGKLGVNELDTALTQARHFEEMLAADGTLFLKFWCHLPEKAQKKALKDQQHMPGEHYRYGHGKKACLKNREDLLRTAERAIRRTDTADAPWYLIESRDERYRDLTVGRTLAHALERHLAEERDGSVPRTSGAPDLPEAPSAQRTVLDGVDLERALEKKEYKQALNHHQDRLYRLIWQAYREKRSMILAFEGWDAAGKGGVIRRLIRGMDSRLYRVLPVAAPDSRERAHHYLWRFWWQLPRAGRMLIFDRSWYGRVLVERVEGLARQQEWKRAYQEINDFEEQLVDHGILLMKFWLHISADEQLARFKAREDTPYKRYKITEEDWRNRERWNDYRLAVNEMVFRTDTEYAPWELIPANDKRYARIEVLRRVCDRLEAMLDKG